MADDAEGEERVSALEPQESHMEIHEIHKPKPVHSWREFFRTADQWALEGKDLDLGLTRQLSSQSH